jgi:hypothetical protein
MTSHTKAAFVSGAAVLARPSPSVAVSTFTSSSVKPTTVAARAQRAGLVTMVGEKKESTKIPQGFTQYSEQLNGRASMIAIIAALGAEVFNPAHPTIVQQVESVFTTIAGIF